MATTKTLTPTNQAITLAAFTEKPDNRTNVTNDDKLADAVNALNSNIAQKTNVIELQKTSVSIGQKSSWDSVYSEIANGYAGVVIIHFQNGANITGLAYKNNASYGSILGTTDDDSNPYIYAVKNGTSALKRLAYST